MGLQQFLFRSSSLRNMQTMQRRAAKPESDGAKAAGNDGKTAGQSSRSSVSRRNTIIYDKLKRVHQPIDSLLTTSSGFTNFRGFYNLGLILLVVSNLRVALENIMKYGILINPVDWLSAFTHEPTSWPCATLVLLVSHFFILFAFFTEKALAQNKIGESTGLSFHVINGFLTLLVPGFVVYRLHPNPLFSCITLIVYSALFLKGWSYKDCNLWERERLRKKASSLPGDGHATSQGNQGEKQKPYDAQMNASEKEAIKADKDGEEETEKWTAQTVTDGSLLTESATSTFAAFFTNEAYALEQNVVLVNYPDNLTLSDIYYFIGAPTLCYELNFPRIVKIRKRFLCKRMVEVVCGAQLLFGLVQQWCLPLIRNSFVSLQQLAWPQLLERMLKLAIPNHLLWLLWFYLFFHSFLNVTAELIRFADRAFYKDWWNSDNIMEFWSNWNLPVHRFANRHIYKPLLFAGHSRLMASIIVFFVSAFFHEYVVSVPLQMFRIWAFMGMLLQVPVAFLSSKYFHGQAGNILVWFSLILGQPLIELFYVHDYCVTRVWNVTLSNSTGSLAS